MRCCSGERRESPLRWMDPPWRNYADHENYCRHDHHAARQDPEADTVNIRAHATGRNAIIDTPTQKAMSQRAKSAVMFCLLWGKYTPKSIRQHLFSSFKPGDKSKPVYNHRHHTN